jgi:hypothetical protein
LENNIIRHNTILRHLLELSQSKLTLEDRISDIRRKASEISDLIENDLYRTKAKCYPTLWSLIEQYIL